MPLSFARLATAIASTALTVGLTATGALAAADVRGPDVASHQHPKGAGISWSTVKSDGAQFAFVKASEGLTYTNPYFARDFAAIHSAKMVRGAYHYARPRAGTANAIAQARYFVGRTGPLNASGDLPPVLDLERNDGLKPAALITWTRAYLTEVTRLTGRKPIIYTYPDFWRTSMKNTTAFTSYPLWIATYRSAPLLVGGWTDYTFWQYSDKARYRGIAAAVDINLFNGDSAALKRLANPDAQESAAYKPKLTAKLSDSSVKRGTSVRLTGSTSRKLAGEKVYRQGYWSGSWHTWSSAKVSAKGSYRFTIKPTVKAVNTYRVYVKATSKHTAAASPKRKLTVS